MSQSVRRKCKLLVDNSLTALNRVAENYTAAMEPYVDRFPEKKAALETVMDSLMMIESIIKGSLYDV